MIWFVALVVLIVLAAIVIAVLNRFYVKSTRDTALIRTGAGGRRVVIDGGTIAWPFLHKIDRMNMRSMRMVMERAGARLRAGLAEQSERHGFRLIQSGPPQMPLVQFEGDKDAALGEAFCQEALRRGVYMHHRHNMFLSTAHRDADLFAALDATDGAFAALAKAPG